MPVALDEVKRSQVAEAVDAAAIAMSLAAIDSSSTACSWPLAGGQLVITGDGFYVNRAMAVALDQPMTEGDFDLLARRSRAAGVAPECEVCPWADQSVLALAADFGYRPAWFRSVFVQDVATAAPTVRSGLEVRAVEDEADFAAWHGVTVAGFGVGTGRPREIARRWGEALVRLDPDRLLIARLDGVPVGVASLAVIDDVGLLGGMTTMPDARNQGVQNGLISFRLRRARELGCTIAATSAAPGSISERNLRRGGFEIAGTKVALTLPASTSG